MNSFDGFNSPSKKEQYSEPLPKTWDFQKSGLLAEASNKQIGPNPQTI